MWQRGSHAEQRCLNVDGHDQIVALQFDINVTDEGDRGVVDEDIEATPVIDRRGDHAVDVVWRGEIGRNGQRVTPSFGDGGDRLVDGAGNPFRCRVR